MLPSPQVPSRPAASEGELYYIHVPREHRPVNLPVEFLTVQEFLDDEPACKALWEMLSTNFRTRGKFLAIWPAVRYVAVCRRGGRNGGRNGDRNGEVAGLLLVTTPVNWQVDYVVVRPEHRGAGIAAALVAETINQALARRVPYLMLTSREGLRPLYEGVCGFEVVAARDPAAPAAPAAVQTRAG